MRALGTLCLPLLAFVVTAAAPRPETFDDVLKTVDKYVVAIRVKREKDLEGPEISKELSSEIRSYFTRPDGYVTGLLVDPQGYVLTSSYNVAGTITSIEVVLADGGRYSAKLTATDRMDDLALLQIDRGQIDKAQNDKDGPLFDDESWRGPVWSTDPPSAGRIVFAVGRSPDPGRLTVTEGIISAAGRNGNRAFQTDAKLNYGNVGGPLVDLEGRIVGIGVLVGHVYHHWGLNSGIGFGTTTATVLEVLPSLKDGKDIESPPKPLLGVELGDQDPQRPGAVIGAVVPDSAAGRAGLMAGDVIVGLGEKKIDSFRHLRRAIFDYRVGDSVTVKIVRGDVSLDFEVTLGARPKRP